jgi:hypothetical protein
MSSALAMRLSLMALALSVLCFALQLAVTQFHLPLAIPPQGLTFLGVFGLTWPLWAYAAAMYHRALSAKPK